MTKYQTNTGTDKIIFYIIGAVTLVVLALIIVFSINEGKQTQTEANITAFSAKDSEKPKISVSNTFFIFSFAIIFRQSFTSWR